MLLPTHLVRQAHVQFDNKIMDKDNMIIGHADPAYLSASEYTPKKINISTIQIKYLVDFPEPWRIKYSENGDWIDLRAATHLSLKTGESTLIPLGIVVKLPEGYEAHIVPRSSTYKNFGIIQTNHMGVIDNSYCGPNDQWFMSVIAMRDTQIHFGDRICQFRIVEQMPRIPIVEVKELIGEDRGGHGSTGIK